MSKPSSLPIGWTSASIGDLCDLATGGTPRSSQTSYYQGGTIRWLVSGDVHQREIFDCEGRITAAGLENSNARPLPVGSVIIALNGQGKTRGTVAMLRTEATCNQSLVSINPRETSVLASEFLYWNLRSRYEEIRRMTGDDGNERRGLNMPLIRSIRIPIPPLDKQKRIVAVLDQAFTALDRAHANTEANRKDARVLFDAELQLLFEDAAEGRGMLPFDALCEPLTPKVKLKRQDYLDEGAYPIVSQEAELISGYWDDAAAVMETGGPVVVFGDHTCCLKYVDFCFVVGADGTKVLKPVDGLSAEYLYFGLRSQPVEQVGYARHFKALRKVELPNLSLSEQKRVVERLRHLEADCNEFAKSCEAKLADMAALRQSLLQAAFSGQLT